MELTLNKSVIKQMVKGFTKVRCRTSNLPILTHARFQVKAKTLTVMVTDLEQELIYSTPEIVWNTCSELPFLVPLDELKDLAKGKGNEPVKIELMEDAKLWITTLVGNLPVARTVSSLASAEFPESRSRGIETKPYDLPEMLRLFKKAAPLVKQDDSNYILGGVRLDCQNKAIVATDSKRIGVFYPPESPLDAHATLPVTKVLTSDLLQQEGGEIGWHKDEYGAVDVMVLKTEHWCYSVRAMDGIYPKWQSIIPERGEKATIKFTDSSIEAIKQACQVLPDQDETNHGITFHADDKMVVLLALGEDDELSHAVIPEATFDGRSTTFRMNRHFFMDAFNSGFNTMYVSRSERRPLRFEGDVPGMYVLMPIDAPHPSEALTKYIKQIQPPTQGDEVDQTTSELKTARHNALKEWTAAKMCREGLVPGKPVSDQKFARLTKAMEKTEDAYYKHIKCPKPTEPAITPTKENTMASKKSRAERKAEKAAAATAAEANTKVGAAEAKHAKAQAKVAAKADKKAKEPKAEKKAKPEPKAKAEDNAETLTKRYRREYTMYEAIAAGKKPMTAEQVIEASNKLYVKGGGTDNLGQSKHVWGIVSKVLVHCGAVAYADGKYSIS